MSRNKVLVVGDVMIDRYVTGSASRISPEAPVPVLSISKSYDKLGGAANVANNLIWNSIPVDICSVIGADAEARRFLELANENGIGTGLVIQESGRRTTVKIRCMAQNNQQILRLDQETAIPLEIESEEEICRKLSDCIADYALVILSDYMKGVLGHSFTQRLIDLCNRNGIRVIVDVKDPDYMKYAGAYLIKPNEDELRLLMKTNARTEEQIVGAARELKAKASVNYVLTTRGAKGMLLVEESGNVITIPSEAKQIYDVTGAGDTVIAYLACCLIRETPIIEAVRLANVAAGIKVSKIGSAVVTENEVLKALCVSNKKLIGDTDIDKIERKDKKIVFTNGCFDILHAGHIYSLQQAKALGDILIVGINSDESVGRLKGVGRPYNSLADRISVLSSLEFVDYVCVFSEDTPLKLIRKIRPDVLVKGKDYENKKVVGQDEVEAYGGKVVLIDLKEGLSSTRLINQLKDKI